MYSWLSSLLGMSLIALAGVKIVFNLNFMHGDQRRIESSRHFDE